MPCVDVDAADARIMCSAFKQAAWRSLLCVEQHMHGKAAELLQLHRPPATAARMTAICQDGCAK